MIADDNERRINILRVPSLDNFIFWLRLSGILEKLLNDIQESIYCV